MRCPLCGKRRARRACPALSQTICPLCCGTKRLTEIQCPDNCPHLAVAREHPAAQVRRRQEEDVAVLLPTVQRLTERQQQLFFVFQSAISRYQPDGLVPLLDADVAEAASACAATLETASRGVIYEQRPGSAPAQRLAEELKATLTRLREHGPTIYDSEVALALRAVERGARDIRQTMAGDRAYLELMARILQQQAPATPGEPDRGSSIITP